eukprot:NODE_1212_length_1773_cov_0.407407.p1 type:complete len:418 gc:universal NODE_1212_length_1773_cov_0.407407:1539-286(-)
MLLNFVIMGTTFQDCQVLMSFLRDLNMHNTDATLYNSIPANCCFISYFPINGIQLTCGGFGITSLEIKNLNINGTLLNKNIPPNLTSLTLKNNIKLNSTIPSAINAPLVDLVLSNNALYGSIPTDLPNTLKLIDFSVNALTGNIPSLPPTLQYLYIQKNRLSGVITTTFPSTLLEIIGNKNQFKGNVPTFPDSVSRILMDSNNFTGTLNGPFPANLTRLSFSNNQLTGNLPLLPPKVVNVFFDFNQLTGPIPAQYATQVNGSLVLNSNALTGCQNTTFVCSTCKLSDNRLRGELTFKAPTVLNLTSNLITDVNVLNQTAISTCDLSNNPMLNTISAKSFASKCSSTNAYADPGIKCDVSTVASAAVITNSDSSSSNRNSELNFASSVIYVSDLSSLEADSNSVVTRILYSFRIYFRT